MFKNYDKDINFLRKRVLLIKQAKKYNCYNSLVNVRPFYIDDNSVVIDKLLKIYTINSLDLKKKLCKY
jgi:hypothetical protein